MIIIIMRLYLICGIVDCNNNWGSPATSSDMRAAPETKEMDQFPPPSLFRVLTEAYSTRKGGKEGKASLRPPSYTDRILCHSQPDSQSFLKIQRYDMCDALTASDHRPVAAAIDITVMEPRKKAVSTIDEDLSGTTASSGAALTLPQYTRLVKIRLYNIQLQWREVGMLHDAQLSSFGDSPRPGSANELVSSSSNKSSSNDGFRSRDNNLYGDGSSCTSHNSTGSMGSAVAHTCIIYFPLQSEDPLSHLRKGVLMNQALNIGRNKDGREAAAKHLQSIHSFKFSDLKDGFLEIKSLACIETVR